MSPMPHTSGIDYVYIMYGGILCIRSIWSIGLLPTLFIMDINVYCVPYTLCSYRPLIQYTCHFSYVKQRHGSMYTYIYICIYIYTYTSVLSTLGKITATTATAKTTAKTEIQPYKLGSLGILGIPPRISRGSRGGLNLASIMPRDVSFSLRQRM